MKGSKRQITPELDLHGLRAATAEQLLEDFMHVKLENGLEDVIVIHGHGRGVIRDLVDAWIINHQHLVTDHQPTHDGGATYIRFKR